jgi:hypothetical protein
MRTPKGLIEDLRILEEEVGRLLADMEVLDKQEMDAEPEHRKMVSELMNADFIAKLPNQVMRDDALENYILNNDQYADRHRAYLILKMRGRSLYRKYRYLEECMKNRRAELQVLNYGGDK